MVCPALSIGQLDSWIVDSGATCHMCNNKALFANLQQLKEPLEVTLGDGHPLVNWTWKCYGNVEAATELKKL